MKLLQSLVLTFLPLSSLAADSATPDRFLTAYSQQRSSSASVKLDDKSFQDLTKGSRDFTVAVLLTALDAKFGCSLCNDFQPEWELLTRSWMKGDKEAASRMVFGTLDFAEGRETFQALQLQSAPVMLLFHPTTGPNARPDGKIDRFDFMAANDRAEPIHAWLVRHLPDSFPKPPLIRPFAYFKFATITTAILGGITLLTVAWPYMVPFIQNRNLWAAISLITILLFTSGHMFNHIRKVPYVAQDDKGRVTYFAGGFANQLGMETQIIAAIYGILTFTTISLALKVPRMSNPRSQQIAVFVWGSIMLGMFSFLMSIFRTKSPGYPFWLPPF